MKRILVALTILFLISAAGYSLKTEYDSGPIEEMSEGFIYVKGNLGSHVFETFRDCSWCTVDLEVLVSFNGYTKATIQPYNNTFGIKPLTVFIVRDGRE